MNPRDPKLPSEPADDDLGTALFGTFEASEELHARLLAIPDEFPRHEEAAETSLLADAGAPTSGPAGGELVPLWRWWPLAVAALAAAVIAVVVGIYAWSPLGAPTREVLAGDARQTFERAQARATTISPSDPHRTGDARVTLLEVAGHHVDVLANGRMTVTDADTIVFVADNPRALREDGTEYVVCRETDGSYIVALFGGALAHVTLSPEALQRSLGALTTEVLAAPGVPIPRNTAWRMPASGEPIELDPDTFQRLKQIHHGQRRPGPACLPSGP